MKKYYLRVVDKILDLKLRAFGAVNSVGPKWCGKTEISAFVNRKLCHFYSFNSLSN